jgi:hypothetical protein
MPSAVSSPASRCAVAIGRPARRASSVSVSRRLVSSNAVSMATARETTVAPGWEVLPAIGHSFHSVEA